MAALAALKWLAVELSGCYDGLTANRLAELLID